MNQTPTPPNRNRAFLEDRRMIFVMLFGVMGVLGVPLIWLSPKFNLPEKWFWSIAVTLYTAFLFFIAGAIVWWAYCRVMGY